MDIQGSNYKSLVRRLHGYFMKLYQMLKSCSLDIHASKLNVITEDEGWI